MHILLPVFNFASKNILFICTIIPYLNKIKILQEVKQYIKKKYKGKHYSHKILIKLTTFCNIYIIQFINNNKFSNTFYDVCPENKHILATVTAVVFF